VLDLAQNADAEAAIGGLYVVKRMLLHPELWRSYPGRLPLTWKKVRFEAASLHSVAKDEKGLYTFVAKPGVANHPACAYLLYVGKVQGAGRSFRARFREYLDEASPAPKARIHISMMLRAWSGFLWFYYAPIDDEDLIGVLEDDLIASLVPPYNLTYPAQIRRLAKGIFR
jgi:hypothetical protein